MLVGKCDCSSACEIITYINTTTSANRYGPLHIHRHVHDVQTRNFKSILIRDISEHIDVEFCSAGVAKPRSSSWQRTCTRTRTNRGVYRRI